MNDYQEKIVKFDLNGDIRDLSKVNFALIDKILGLPGESGEVADKIKKVMRDQNGQITPTDKLLLGKELGDVLWYLESTARYLGLDLESLAQGNIDKLESRLERGKINGRGDER